MELKHPVLWESYKRKKHTKETIYVLFVSVVSTATFHTPQKNNTLGLPRRKETNMKKLNQQPPLGVFWCFLCIKKPKAHRMEGLGQ